MDDYMRMGGRKLGKAEDGSQLKQKKLDRPELKICEANPYHDAPDSSAEGIYEAGKEAQLEADRKLLALLPKPLEMPELREKIKDIFQPVIAWNFPTTLGKGHKHLSWDEGVKEIKVLLLIILSWWYNPLKKLGGLLCAKVSSNTTKNWLINLVNFTDSLSYLITLYLILPYGWLFPLSHSLCLSTPTLRISSGLRRL